MGDVKEFGTSFVMPSRNFIEFYPPTGPYGTRQKALLVRLYPKDSPAPSSGPVATSSGSGFFVGQDVVATNAHVVEGASAATVIIGIDKRTAEVLVRDQANDIALLRVSKLDGAAGAIGSQKCLKVLDPDITKAGDRVFVLGYPLGGLLASSLSITEGLVTSIRGIRDDPRMIQISAPIQPGNSGSPLLDARGRVVGVVTATLNPKVTLATQDALPQNANFAVRATYLRSLMALVPGATCSVPSLSADTSPAGLQASFGAAVVTVEVQ
jgi:serine protease Do